MDTTEFLQSLGICVCPIWAIIPEGGGLHLSDWKIRENVFFKRRSGARGIGAFRIELGETGWIGRNLSGQFLKDECAINSAWKVLAMGDDVLIQPCLKNHSQLANLSNTEEAMTLRYISVRDGGECYPLVAFIHIPFSCDGQSKCILTIPIDIERGILKSPSEYLNWSDISKRYYQEVEERIVQGTHIPFWSQLVSSSHLAHQHIPGVRAIAWDWIISPEGPVLLEGNSGWGGYIPQMILGPFLSNNLENTYQN